MVDTPATIIWLGSAALALLVMELWAGVLHRFVWHGLLWHVHRSHHRGRGDIAATPPPHGVWEHNDVLSTTHAPVALALILFGCAGPHGVWREVAYGFGLGMSAFGILYILVHDGLAHGRLPVQKLLRLRGLQAVKRAHCVHHRTGGAPFGLFLGPWVLLRQRRLQAARRVLSRSQEAPTAALQRNSAALPKLRHTSG